MMSVVEAHDGLENLVSLHQSPLDLPRVPQAEAEATEKETVGEEGCGRRYKRSIYFLPISPYRSHRSP